eukprot:675565-Pleurochrysis_carterae.AAC.1
MVQPTRRVMPPTAVKRVPHNKKTGASSAVQHPPVPKSLVAYDFKHDELLTRLAEHCEPAASGSYLRNCCVLERQASHICQTDAHPCRFDCATSPIKIAIMLYADAFTRCSAHFAACQRVARASSQPLDPRRHVYCILNLEPSMRMSIPAIQVATLTRLYDSKAAGMVE